MDLHIRTTFSGRYKLLHRAASGAVKATYEFDNLITDTGLNNIGSGAQLFTYCHLSTNAAAPATTDTTMGGTTVRSGTDSPIFTNAVSNSGAPDYIRTHLFGYTFATGAATGTWSSIGLGSANSDSSICTKTRIRDAGGTPTSITILAGESLDVQYELRSRTEVTTGSGTVSGNSYTVQPYNLATTFSTTRTQSVPWGGFSGTLHAANGSIAHATVSSATPFTASLQFSGTGFSASGSPASYAAGSFFRDVTWVWPTTVVTGSNQLRGIAVIFNTANVLGSGWGFLLATNVGKTNTQQVTFTARFSWGRA